MYKAWILFLHESWVKSTICSLVLYSIREWESIFLSGKIHYTLHIILSIIWFNHSCIFTLQKVSFRSMKISSQMLQNLLCLCKKKTHIVFFVFHFKQLYFFPYECPSLHMHVDIDQGIHKVKTQSYSKRKTT